MVKYPAQIDDPSSLPIVIDNVTPFSAEIVNRLRDAIIAIENELGTNPAGNAGTVKAKLDSLSNIINNLNDIQLSRRSWKYIKFS